MATVTEISKDVFRIACFNPAVRLSFAVFLVRDDEPVLYHTGLRSCFDEIKESVDSLIGLDKLRHIGFSHFESDECGALNEWLAVAPHASAFSGPLAAATSLNDFATRPPRVLNPGEVLETGSKRFQVKATPHLPHGWDAAMLYEETDKTLFVSDLFLQPGDPEPMIESGLADRAHQFLVKAESSLFAHSTNYNSSTRKQLEGLAALTPRTLAVMHGSSYSGDASGELLDLADGMEDAFRDQLAPLVEA